jgi:hypothetical protein
MVLLGLACGSLPVRAAVEVQGTSASIQVVAQNARVSEVLRALTESLKSINCKEMTDLDGVISGTYEGSLEDVLGRVLRGYDYVITTQGAAIDIVVIGRSGSAPAVVAPIPGAVAPLPTSLVPVTAAPALATVAPGAAVVGPVSRRK